MTDRLYYTDSYLRTFNARVVTVGPCGDGEGSLRGVVLDRTAFYPTSGGQPHDTGTLADLPVVDVIDAGDSIVHVVDAPVPGLAPGSEVHGIVDADIRFDHMQQHTGQHVLSAAFLQVLGAQTVSVHLDGSSTLDLALVALPLEDARKVEDHVNQIVFENRPVTVRFVDAAEAAALGLRRPPRRTGPIRVIEVVGYDRSACGGTHTRSTGEIGPILIRGSERIKGQVRVEFLCGWRALRDYQWKHALISEWSARLTVGDRDLAGAFDRLARDAREQQRALAEARNRLIAYEAAERLAALAGSTGPKILRLGLERRDPEEVRRLLRELTEREPCIVLAGIEDAGRLFFARSPGEGPDMAAILGRVARAGGGRGGGTKEFAQGAVPAGEAVRQALTLAEAEVRNA